MVPWFFFSYATPDLDRPLKKFYADLLKDLSLSVVPASDATGFVAWDSIRTGNLWDPKLREGLRTCRVLVPVFSPNYLASEYCGKEFQVCLDRQNTAGGSNTAIFPVIWGEPGPSFHNVMQGFQYTDSDFPPSYKADGLWDLSRRKKADYAQLVTKLARKIAKAGRDHPLGSLASLPDLASIPNPFADAPARPAALKRSANFAFFAGRQHELGAHRTECLRYGQGGLDWRPFAPTCDDSVGMIANQAAASQRLYFNEVSIDDERAFRKAIDDARERHEPMVVIVDPWTVRVQNYRDLIVGYDFINPDYNAVLVAWNSPDTETDAHRDKLKAELQTVFRYIPRTRFYYRDTIDSLEQLQDALARAIAEVQASVITSNKAAQKIDNPAIEQRAQEQGIPLDRQPVVAGPGGLAP